mmetsp:Transcript_16009/g.36935  ORF Transcript_16009/g.36935 Transcript_16009/m.36935 type:complete len:119 (-) Transcript_16009:1450-1806(-)
MLPREMAGKQGKPPDNEVKKKPLAYHVRMSLGFSELRNMLPALLLKVEVAVVDEGGCNDAALALFCATTFFSAAACRVQRIRKMIHAARTPGRPLTNAGQHIFSKTRKDTRPKGLGGP